MKTSFSPSPRLVAGLAVLTLAAALPASAQTVLLRDDFNGTTLNTTTWGLGTWTLGRTQLGNSPVVGNGMARLTFDTSQATST